MDVAESSTPSHLFTVRRWQEDLGEGQTQWRSRLQHVLSGRVFYCAGWDAVVIRMQEIVESERTGDQRADE